MGGRGLGTRSNPSQGLGKKLALDYLSGQALLGERSWKRGQKCLRLEERELEEVHQTIDRSPEELQNSYHLQHVMEPEGTSL